MEDSSENSHTECKPCKEYNMWTIALVVVIIIFIVYMRKICIEHFASKREKAEHVQKNMYPHFYGGTATYDKYKTAIGGDAVEYQDVKDAYKNNEFNVETLSKVV